jgi:hypothetical protein
MLKIGFGAALLYTGFLMVFTAMSTTRSQPAAALPAGVAAIAALAVGVVAGRSRRHRKRSPTAPTAGEDLDYHI